MATTPDDRPGFFAGKCPNCKGELQLPDNREKVICMYCGIEINVSEQKASHYDSAHYFDLAQTAYGSGDYSTAEFNCDKSISIDLNNAPAVALKGWCAGRLSNPLAPRLSELVANEKKAVAIDKSSLNLPGIALETSWLLWRNVKDLTEYFKETVDIEVYGRRPANIGGGTYPRNATEKLQQDMGNVLAFYIMYGGKLKKYEKLFTEIFARDYMNQIIEGLKLAWMLDQSEGVAESSRLLFYLLKDSTDISAKIQKQFQIEFQPISLGIKTRFPNYSIS